MKKNSRDNFIHVDEFFGNAPSSNEKAWALIHKFYHLLLSYMKKNNVSQADLARITGKSRSAISQMFNKTPNISLKKMIEIADSIGLEIDINEKNTQKEVFTYEAKYNAMSTVVLDAEHAWSELGNIIKTDETFLTFRSRRIEVRPNKYQAETLH